MSHKAAAWASARVAAVACVLLASQILSVQAARSAIVYTNTAVTGSSTATSNIINLLNGKYNIPTQTSASQPSPGALAGVTGYIVYAAGGNSYAAVEDVTPGSAKLAELTDYVTNRGGVLVLVNGASDGANSFLPLIEAIRGSPVECTPTTFADGDRIVNRVVLSTALVNVEVKAIDVTSDMKLSGLACKTGQPIYSVKRGRGQPEPSAAIMWPVGFGAIVWIGADFSMKTNGIQLVVAGGLDAAAEFQPFPPSPAPPPPPPARRRAKSPPPSPPPPPPPFPSPPRPKQGKSPKPAKASPPPPIIEAPPPYEDYAAPPPPKRGGKGRMFV